MSATALYVSARGDMIGAAAFMVALMFARRAILTSWTAPGLLAAGFGVAAFASSAAGAGLPLVLLTYDAWLLRTDGWRRRLWRAYVPAIAAVVLASGWRLSVDEPSAGGMFYTMLSESVVVWRYVALVAIPTGQSIVHDARSVPSLMDPFALVALAGIAAAVAGAIWLRRIAPLAGVGVIWCVAGLAATSIFPQRDLMAEPRAYLAAAGLMLAVFTTAAPSFVTRRAARIAGAAVLALLAVLTSMRLPVWSDPLRLWTEAVERSPGAWLAHAEFAEALKEAGQCDRAVKEAAIAGDLNPRFILDPAAGWAPCPRPAPAR